MAKVLYTAEATVTGGREQGHGKTTDGALEVQLRTPTEMGGGGGGTNPEQLFAVGYAACFEGALGVVGRREKAEVGDASIDSRVDLVTTEAAASRSPSSWTSRCRRCRTQKRPSGSLPAPTRSAPIRTPPAATST